MDFCFRTFAALFVLFGATTGAAGPSLQDAWAGVRNRSQELHRDARRVLLEAPNGYNDIDDATTKIGWIETEDKCDPETLKKAPEPCLAKILNVSMSYSSALEMFSSNQSCARLARTLIPALSKLQTAMTDCVMLNVPPVASTSKSFDAWEEKPLCLYTLRRLFSFSILTARVFAVGNPAHHTAGPPQKCA